ncbi:hypothetical protein D3C85_1776220 [compost metagenome]
MPDGHRHKRGDPLSALGAEMRVIRDAIGIIGMLPRREMHQQMLRTVNAERAVQLLGSSKNIQQRRPGLLCNSAHSRRISA